MTTTVKFSDIKKEWIENVKHYTTTTNSGFVLDKIQVSLKWDAMYNAEANERVLTLVYLVSSELTTIFREKVAEGTSNDGNADSWETFKNIDKVINDEPSLISIIAKSGREREIMTPNDISNYLTNYFNK